MSRLNQLIATGAWSAAVLLVGCDAKLKTADTSGGGGGGSRRTDLRIAIQNNLRNIGFAYLQAAVTAPPRNADELKAHLEGAEAALKSPREHQPFEIVWGVNPSQPGASGLLLAWEKTADKDGGRCVLMADCQTLGYLSALEFEGAPRAKGR